MPTAMAGRPSLRGGMPRRRRKSTAVTMRPRRLSTPAISGGASGTRVSRSGMNTSCTREIGSPNSWPSSITVTYSMTVSSNLSVVAMAVRSRRLDPLDGRFLEGRDQAGTIELGDEVVEAGLASALDRRRRGDRRERDDRQLGGARVAPHRLGELEAVHAGHLDVGDDHVEALARLQSRERLVGPGRGGDVVARRLEHRGEHVAEEMRIVDQQQVARERLHAQLLAAEPVLERERQEMADVDDLGGVALDHRRAEHAGHAARHLDVELVLDD